MSYQVRKSELSEKYILFIAAVMDGKTPEACVEAAGYSGRQAYWRLISHPAIIAGIHAEVQRQLVGECAPAALRVLRQLMADPTVGARVRADVAVKLMGMAGHVAPSPVARTDTSDKGLSEMTADELHAHMAANMAEIDRLEAELAARAKDVLPALDSQDNTQDQPPSDAKPLNYLD